MNFTAKKKSKKLSHYPPFNWKNIFRKSKWSFWYIWFWRNHIHLLITKTPKSIWHETLTQNLLVVKNLLKIFENAIMERICCLFSSVHFFTFFSFSNFFQNITRRLVCFFSHRSPLLVLSFQIIEMLLKIRNLA